MRAKPPAFTASSGNGADLYVNSKYFGTVFASAEPADVAARLAATQRPLAERCATDGAPEAVGWKTIPSWYVIGDADKVIPPDIQLKFATRAKSKIYHVPGGDHPSMIGHPEVTAAAIRDAANARFALADNEGTATSRKPGDPTPSVAKRGITARTDHMVYEDAPSYKERRQ